jgi:taurine dioxygenase
MTEVHFNLIETEESRRTGMGAVVEGLDVKHGVDRDIARSLRDAALRFPVLVIRDQRLDPEALVTFGRTFGELQPHTAERYRHETFPDLSYVSNVDRQGNTDDYGQTKRALGWHSDGSFLRVPYSFTILYGVEVPSEGGATLFSNTHLAYERLPGDVKAEVGRLTAIHAIGSGPDGAGSPSRNKRFEEPERYPDIEKPLVMMHPENGRPALFINPMHTSHIVLEDRERAEQLYNYLVRFSTQPELVYRHDWRRGDIVIWDQRCTMHRAAGGVRQGERRTLLRALVKGTDDAMA